MTVKWNGKKVLTKVRKAQIVGVNQTMAAAERHAIANHTWQNRTGILEGSIGIATFARPKGQGVAGEWGSQDVVYALVQELGSTKKNIPARPYLRPAADAEYPGLNRRIRRAYG